MSVPNKYIDSLILFMDSQEIKSRLYANDCLISFLYKLEEFDVQKVIKTISAMGETYFVWAKPGDEVFFIGFSPLITINVDGSNRLADTEKQIFEIGDKLLHNWEEFDLKNLPLFLGGMKFSSGKTSDLWENFSDSDWFIPKYLFFNYKGSSYFLYNFYNTNNFLQNVLSDLGKPFDLIQNLDFDKSEPSLPEKISEVSEAKEMWFNKVESALESIHLNRYQKIVLSRKIDVGLDNKPAIDVIIEKLSNKYPDCYIFAFHKSNSVFFGASPEKLARISDGWIEADALAGSTSRGSTPEDDEIFANSLLNSEKNLIEQNAVVNFIVDSFSDFTDEIIYEPVPLIRKLPNIQHLWTPIRGKLKAKKSVFSILKEIHPTPAICGVPWSTALTHIIEMENYDRGLFTGIIGWFNFECEGEFAVAIRSALLKDKLLHVFAGCGIVKGSNPEQEYEETDLKLNAVLTLFENEKTNKSKHPLDTGICK
ncbi:MAG: isochorismate synthase [bacterium]